MAADLGKIDRKGGQAFLFQAGSQGQTRPDRGPVLVLDDIAGEVILFPVFGHFGLDFGLGHGGVPVPQPFGLLRDHLDAEPLPQLIIGDTEIAHTLKSAADQADAGPL